MQTPLRFKTISTKNGVQLRTGVTSPHGTSKGVCVLLHGRTENIEKYEEVIGELLSRQFQVATLDWRGQGLSTRFFSDRLTQHVENFTEYDEDFDAFIDEIVRPLQGPYFILAHSMGAHNTLRALHKYRGFFLGAILSAPMAALHQQEMIRRAAVLMNWLGQSQRPVLNNKSTTPLHTSFEKNLLTSDPIRYHRMQNQLKSQPDLLVGAPSWRWIASAIESMSLVKSFAHEITAPVLILGAGQDQICDTKAAKDLASRMPKAQFFEIAKAKHELFMERDEVRVEVWQKCDAFLASLF